MVSMVPDRPKASGQEGSENAAVGKRCEDRFGVKLSKSSYKRTVRLESRRTVLNPMDQADPLLHCQCHFQCSSSHWPTVNAVVKHWKVVKRRVQHTLSAANPSKVAHRCSSKHAECQSGQQVVKRKVHHKPVAAHPFSLQSAVHHATEAREHPACAC